MISFPLHPAIVHFPIALLICGSIAALGYLHGRPRVELRILGWCLLFLGWLTLLLAILSGILAQGGLPPQAPYRHILDWHTGSGLALAVLYGDLLYRGWRHNARRGAAKAGWSASVFLADSSWKWLLTIQLLLGIGLVIFSSWLGGRLVYEFGVGVQ